MKKLQKFCRNILRILLFLPSHLLSWIGVRIIKIEYPDALGHLTVEPACFLMEKELKRLPYRFIILLVPYIDFNNGKKINKALVEYWKDYYLVITSPKLCDFFVLMWKNKCIKHEIKNYVMNENSTATYYSLLSQWESRQPILQLKLEHEKNGDKILFDMGLPKNAWFIVFSARDNREASYDPEHFYRHCDIETYYLALKMVIEKGGWCIRLGTNKTKPLSEKILSLGNVIDYAHSKYYVDWMDLYLCAKAYFHLGNNSGLCNLPTAFGVPNVLVNVIPFSSTGNTEKDITIPKLLGKKEGLIPFKNILSSELANMFYNESYKKRGIQFYDNTEKEILDVVSEMFENLEKKETFSKEDENLQQKFKSLFVKGNYGFGCSSSTGKVFLNNYKYLV